MTEILHSKFGGSSAARWLACPGSVKLIESMPPKASSGYADEGSAAHALAALCLSKDQHPRDYLGSTMEGFDAFIVDGDMIDAVTQYLNVVEHERAQTSDSIYFVEHGFELKLRNADPGEVFGTNDALVYHPSTGRLRVFDYKHGKGVSVLADDNAQLKFYAAGAVFEHQEWKISEVVLTIVQPRALDVETNGAVRDWRFDPIDLFEFLAELDDGVRRVKAVAQSQTLGSSMKDSRNVSFDAVRGQGEPYPHYKTGDHCRWCDAAAVCPLKEAEIMDAAKLDLSDIAKIDTDVLPIVSELDTERLGQILKAGALLSDWLATVQEYVQGLVLSGTPVPGWKAVEKIGRAKWVADESAVAAYADMMFGVEPSLIRPPKLTTIGDATKLIKAAGADKADVDDFLLKFTLKESSGLTIAPESDRRPAVNAVERDLAEVSI